MRIVPFVARLTAVVFVAAARWPRWPASLAPVAAENGMVVTAQHLATPPASTCSGDSGNAVDAAVAVGYALAGRLSGRRQPGGGGFMTIQLPTGARPSSTSARGAAGRQGRTCTSARTATSSQPPARTATWRSACQTGVGMEYARARVRHAEARAALLAPAIKVREQEGFALDQGDVDLLATATEDFRKDPATAAIFLNAGRALPGDKLVQKDLARRWAHPRRRRRRLLRRAGGGAPSSPAARPAARHHHPGRPRPVQDARTEARWVRLPRLPRDLGTAAQSSRRRDHLRDPQRARRLPAEGLGVSARQAVHVQIEAMRHAYVDRNSYPATPTS